MVNKPLIRPYFLGWVALGGVARILLILTKHVPLLFLAVDPKMRGFIYVTFSGMIFVTSYLGDQFGSLYITIGVEPQ